MKTTALLAAAAAVFVPPAPESSPLTGTWVADLDTQQNLPTDVYLVQGGIYACESCRPPRRYPADGTMRSVDEDRRVMEAGRIVDARTFETRIAQPDLDRITRMRVARDGRTATYVSFDGRPGIRGRLRTEYLARRIAAAPPGSHAVSGSWQGIRYVAVPVQLRTTHLSDTGAQLSYRSGSGYSYTARYDGPFAPIAGPYDGSISVSVRRIDPYRLIETRRRGSEDVQRRTYTVARDRQTMEIATTDLATSVTFRITARRKR